MKMVTSYELREVIENSLHELLGVYEGEIYRLKCVLEEKEILIENLNESLEKHRDVIHI